MIVELHNGQNAIRGYIATMQADMTNVYGILSRIDQRLDRIERRLELRELAEAQSRTTRHRDRWLSAKDQIGVILGLPVN